MTLDHLQFHDTLLSPYLKDRVFGQAKIRAMNEAFEMLLDMLVLKHSREGDAVARAASAVIEAGEKNSADKDVIFEAAAEIILIGGSQGPE